MATGGGSYSFSLTTFSPSGKLVQIEHALAAVGQGTSSLGIKGFFFSFLSLRFSAHSGIHYDPS
jgi:hypothetical protein